MSDDHDLAMALRIQLHLIAELRATFPDDPSAPGIIVSQVKSERFYVAAARYRAPIGQQREVVASARANDLPNALSKLAAEWARRRAGYLKEGGRA